MPTFLPFSTSGAVLPASGHVLKDTDTLQGHYPIFGTAVQYGKDAGAYPGNYNGFANVSTVFAEHVMPCMSAKSSELTGPFELGYLCVLAFQQDLQISRAA